MGTCPGQDNAATFFNSFADVTATVSLGGGASWSDLGFAAGSSFLGATAQVRRYEITLAPGARDRFSVHLTQFVVTEVAHVPEPAAGWLVVAWLGALAIAARRRQRLK